MKQLTTLTPALIPALIASCLLVTTAFASNAKQSQDDYHLVLIKDCQVVAKRQMNKQQIASYVALQQEEKKMALLEHPVAALEQELEALTEEIEYLTELAIKETDDSLYIDKGYLQQQELAVAQLDSFMAVHQQSFDLLGEQGNIVGNKGDAFVKVIEEAIEHIDYDTMQINAPGNSEHNARHNYQCGSYNITI
jgi:cell division protein FtsB